MVKIGVRVGWVTGLCLSALMTAKAAEPDLAVPAVMPTVETEAVDSSGDAADDAAIWRNPADPRRSLVLGTDKRTGLLVYDLQGKVLQALPVGYLNNVDIRTVRGRIVAVGSNRSDASLTAFEIDPATGTVRETGRVPTGMREPYGFCLYHVPNTDELYAFVPDKTGAVPVFSLKVGQGTISGERVHTHQLGSQAEGCVVDDRSGLLYVGEENVGVWRLEAVPTARQARGTPVREAKLIARVTTPTDGLTADVEGLALLPDTTPTGGVLIASSQGDSTFAVFNLESLDLEARFRVGPNETMGIDRVSGTDGIAIAAGDFGTGFGEGLFVVQDDVNEEDTGSGRQNFKYVPLAEIRRIGIGMRSSGSK